MLSTFFEGISLIKLKLISFFNARYLTVSLRGPVLNLTARAKPELISKISQNNFLFKLNNIVTLKTFFTPVAVYFYFTLGLPRFKPSIYSLVVSELKVPKSTLI